jgi:hypothetical protein
MTTSNNNGRALNKVDLMFYIRKTQPFLHWGQLNKISQRDLATSFLYLRLYSFLRNLQLGMRMSYLSALFRPSKRLNGAAVVGDVTDIRIRYGNNIVKNISS